MTETQTQNAPAHSTPAWSAPDLENPHAKDDKAARVRAMFGAIARAYDLNNRLHSLWRDESWRRFAVKQADVQPTDDVLDIACGTGDLTQAFAKHTRARTITGADFTREMLDIAEHKRAKLNPALADRITYQNEDAMSLSFDDESFDVLSIAFGIRNVQRPDQALAEFHRVLRPGGRLIILEFDKPTLAPVRWFNDLYSATIMPRTATWIARDTSGAYHYLPKSVETFMTSDQLADAAKQAGFSDPESTKLTLGICACTRATKP